METIEKKKLSDCLKTKVEEIMSLAVDVRIGDCIGIAGGSFFATNLSLDVVNSVNQLMKLALYLEKQGL